MIFKDELEKILNDIFTLKKLKFQQLRTLTETNQLDNLIEITNTIVKLIKRTEKKKIIRQSVIDVIEVGSVQQPQGQVQMTILDLINSDDCVTLLNILFILKDKLSNTVYEWVIKDIANQFLAKIKPLKCYEEIKKDLINEITNSFLDENFMDPEKEQNVKKLFKDSLFDNIDDIVSKFQSYIQIYNFFSLKIIPFLVRELATVKPKQKIKFLGQCLAIITKFIFPLQIQLLVEKNALSETRRFKPVVQRQFLQNNSKLVSILAPLLNEMILCPAEIDLQTNLFVVLRRMYYLWGERCRNSLFLVIVNISLFSKTDADVKQAAIFSYKIVNQKRDVQFVNLIQNSQNLKFIKDSPYFSSKAYVFLNDVGAAYNTNDLKLPFWKLRKCIESGDIWQYNIIITKSGTLLTWEFQIFAYDIKFGLYKVQNMKKLDINEYQTEKNSKIIIKAAKLSGSKTSYKGSLFLKSGIYRLVFDNSYSYLRSKQILYSFHILEQL